MAHRARAARARHQDRRRRRRERAVLATAPRSRRTSGASCIRSPSRTCPDPAQAGAARATCGSTPTSPARRSPPAASRPSSADAARSTPTARSRRCPPIAERRQRARRDRHPPRRRREGRREGHAHRAPPRTRRAGPRRGARSPRRRRAAARAPRRSRSAWVPFATVERSSSRRAKAAGRSRMRADSPRRRYAQLEGTKPEARSVGAARDRPVHYVFPRPYVTTLERDLREPRRARERARDQPRAQYHVRRRVELPPKRRSRALPGPFDGKGPLMRRQRRISVSGPSIEEDFTLESRPAPSRRTSTTRSCGDAHETDDAFRATRA